MSIKKIDVDTEHEKIEYRDENGESHREGGPAIEWTDGRKQWHYHRDYIEKMDRLLNIQMDTKNGGIMENYTERMGQLLSGQMEPKNGDK